MIADRSRLDAALAGLERAFGPRRDRIAPVDACTHCFDPEDIAALAGPIADIPDRLFSSAVRRWGTTLERGIGWWLPELHSGRLDLSFSGDLPDIARELTAWVLAEAPLRVRDGDLSPEDAYSLRRLALPEAQRWP